MNYTFIPHNHVKKTLADIAVSHIGNKKELEARFTATIEKVSNVKGTKKLASGYFVDLPYCPLCKKHVPSLMQCLKENH